MESAYQVPDFQEFVTFESMNFISKVSQHLTDWFCVESQSVSADSMPDLQSLEDRVLYSASPIPIELLVEAPNVDVDLEQMDQQLDILTEAVEQLQYDDSSDLASLQFDSDDPLPQLVFGNEPQAELPDEEPSELIVIDSAADASGEMLIDAINVLTGVGVAANDDLMRIADQSGDGDLEYTAGLLNNDIAFSSSIIESWNYSIQETLADESGTSNEQEASQQNDLADFNTDGKSAVVLEDATAEVAREIDSASQAAVAVGSVAVGLENFGIQFTPADFDFTDPEGDPLQSIRIESVPVDGSMNPFGELTFFGMPIDQMVIDSNGGFVIASDSILNLQWNPPAEVHGTNVATFEFSVRDGQTWSEPATIQLDLNAEDRLLVSTSGDSSATTSIPGDGSGTLLIGGSDPTFGDDTFGFLSEQFEPFGVSVDAVHFVNRGIEIGSGITAFLNEGDILFSVKSVAPVGPGPVALPLLPSDPGLVPVAVMAGDIVRFRPTSDDFSTGTYAIVASLEQMYPAAPADYELNAFSLIEQDVIVGDRLLQAGDILFSDTVDGGRPGNADGRNDIKVLSLIDTGSASTGSISLLVEGAQVGISQTISGLDIIEARTTVGSGSEVVLEAGSILASVERGENVGDNNIAVTPQDIFALEFSSTNSATSIAIGDAFLFFDGSDVGGDQSVAETSIDAVSLLGNPDPAATLELGQGVVDIQENDVYRFGAADFVSDATQNNLASIVLTGLPDPAGGTLLFRNEAVTVGQVVDADELEFLVYRPEFNQQVNGDMFQYRAASDSEVLAESAITLNITPRADDVLIGSGTGVDAVFDTDIDITLGTAGDQNQQEIAHIENGETVVVWRSSDGGVDEIRLQRFSSELTPIGDEIVFLDSSISGAKTSPSVTGLDDGGFLVTATVNNGTDTDIWAARYNDSGQHVDVATGASLTPGPEILLGGNLNQYDSDVARLQDGFVIIYRTSFSGLGDVRARVFHDDGFQNDIRISLLFSETGFSNPAVEQLEQGGFVVALNQDFPLLQVSSVAVQFFDTNGIAESGLEFFGGNINSVPSVSVLENNQTVVVWSESTPATPGNPAGASRIEGVILETDGDVLFPPGQVTIAQVDSTNVSPNVVAIGDGGFVVAVDDSNVAGSPQGIVAHRFDAQFASTGSFHDI